ncbi:hypothetical protein ACRALDRAFT_2016829 [Sodiomyces alcalophilus JCM 7366]|uniref:uncharacterized protein n=1 Tax=Sodiomyces alcalophilus JCM 7366 TaxID=591952 RepID=UPI0039B4D695
MYCSEEADDEIWAGILTRSHSLPGNGGTRVSRPVPPLASRPHGGLLTYSLRTLNCYCPSRNNLNCVSAAVFHHTLYLERSRDLDLGIRVGDRISGRPPLQPCSRKPTIIPSAANHNTLIQSADTNTPFPLHIPRALHHEQRCFKSSPQALSSAQRYRYSITGGSGPSSRRASEADEEATRRGRSIACEESPMDDRQSRRSSTRRRVLQHPKPKPKPPYASFLENFVDPFQPGPPADSEHNSVLLWLESPSPSCGRQPHPERAREIGTGDGLHTGCRWLCGTADPNFNGVPFAGGYRQQQVGWPIGDDRDPMYRDMNLAANNIYIRPLHEPFPQHIADIVQHVQQDRDSPGPSLEDIRQDTELNELWMGTGEPEVEDYFKDKIFSKPRPTDSLRRSDRQMMAKHAVPSTGSSLKISTPVPDMLYGYNRHKAFPQQQAQLISMGTEMVATNQYQGLLYPFFVVEFKGDGGSMWVATNQCLGGSASCVNIAERLQHQLRKCQSDEVRPIDTASFSIAMSGTEARLYISWKQNELDYYMANVDSFLLQDHEHYLKFRKYVRNIIDWGKGRRLKQIQDSLETLLEESRKRASAGAKSRMPPSADSGGGSSSSSKTRKTSSTR